MNASSKNHQNGGWKVQMPKPTCADECGHSARSPGCINRSSRKCEKTANAHQAATTAPRPKKSAPKSAAHTSDIASECDQSMKSSRNPGATPGVSVARSMPSGTKMPNSTSSTPTPSTSAHVGARGSLAFIASADARCPAYTYFFLGRSSHAISGTGTTKLNRT